MQDRASLLIKALTGEDIGDMRAMLAMFGEAFHDRERYTQAQPDNTYLKALLLSGSFLAVAAVSEAKVVGGLAAYVLPKFEQARAEIYIYERQSKRLIVAKASPLR